MEYEKAEAPALSSVCGCAGGCCSIYEKPWMMDLLGESFHPGGIELTRRSIKSLQLLTNSRVLDVACGTGASARELAVCGYDVLGIDASEKHVASASKKAQGQARLAFRQATAESLPADLAAFDGVFCECAFSLVSDKTRVAHNWGRVLRPGGRIALSDMIVNGDLPDSLQGEMGDWACLGGAQSKDEYVSLLRNAGFTSIEYVDEREAMLESISALKRKLLVLGVGHLTDVVQDLGASIGDLNRALKDAARAVNSGTLSYGRISASRG